MVNCMAHEIVAALLLLWAALPFFLRWYQNEATRVEWRYPSPALLLTRRKQAFSFCGAMLYMLGGAWAYRSVLPETFQTFAQAFYFTLTTSTTIGYGELSPVLYGPSSLFAFCVFRTRITAYYPYHG